MGIRVSEAAHAIAIQQVEITVFAAPDDEMLQGSRWQVQDDSGATCTEVLVV